MCVYTPHPNVSCIKYGIDIYSRFYLVTLCVGSVYFAFDQISLPCWQTAVCLHTIIYRWIWIMWQIRELLGGCVSAVPRVFLCLLNGFNTNNPITLCGVKSTRMSNQMQCIFHPSLAHHEHIFFAAHLHWMQLTIEPLWLIFGSSRASQRLRWWFLYEKRTTECTLSVCARICFFKICYCCQLKSYSDILTHRLCTFLSHGKPQQQIKRGFLPTTVAQFDDDARMIVILNNAK